MVGAAETKGVKSVYAQPKEGYLLWAMAAYIVRNPARSPEQTKAVYELLDFLLGGWYGAKITLTRSYMTNTQAVPYAKATPAEFKPEEAARIARIDDGVKAKFKQGGVWQNRWPTAVEAYESEWRASRPHRTADGGRGHDSRCVTACWPFRCSSSWRSW